MIVLDTNVISALIRSKPDELIVRWLDSQPADLIWTTAITVFEVRFGLATMPLGHRREALIEAFSLAMQQMGNRVLVFDEHSAEESASISAKLRSLGRPIEMRDVMIAGAVRSRNATLATRNIRHFADASIQIVDPWSG
jgi:predicted nucleic acid-binding protein